MAKLTMTTIFFAFPSLIYFARPSKVRDSSVSGGILSSMGAEASWPMLKKRPKPFRDFFFCACWRWGLCLRPMAVITVRKTERRNA